MYTTEDRPANVVLASVLGVIGGIVALAAMVNGYSSNEDNLFWGVGLGLLITVLFFASAGFLFPNSKGTFGALIVICLINAVAIILAIVLNAFSVWFGIALIVIEVLFLACVAAGKTDKWIEFDRA